jgi:succinate dehydrogenase hydrophobic anchor subunit
MGNLIEEFKKDKNLRKALYITLAIVSYITATLLIKPMILVYTLMVGSGVALVVLLFWLIYATLDLNE